MQNQKELNKALSKYEKLLKNEKGRELSWNVCYGVFSKAREDGPITDEYLDYLCLHLAWFLASWGMLRNSFLMDYNHMIHKIAINWILKEDYKDLHGISCREFVDNKDLKVKFDQLVGKIKESYGDDNNPSDTLVSKILLGTMGCTPAFDSLFDKALKECEIAPRTFKSTTIEKFGQILEVLDCSDELKENYPEMKIVDMAMWQRGYEIDLEEKTNKANEK